QSSPSPTDAARLHRALSQVQTSASKGHFSEAIQACLPALHGPQEVVDIIGSLLAAWQASIKKQKREEQDEMEALVSEASCCLFSI
ncbi:kif19, partial [Symbiodinium microadriaticum]